VRSTSLWENTLAHDERELLRRVQALEEDALSIVFDTYHLALYRYIYHHIGHKETAKDLAAEVFKNLLKAIEKRRGPNLDLKAWLYRVACNLVVDELRRLKHRDHEQLDERLVSADQGLSDQAQTSILRRHVRAALRELTFEQRAVIILRYLEGLGNKEIARLLKISVAAVKSRQHRGLAAIRRHLVRIGAVTEE
jgi:RNA polymerase sigma-70 factor (ECF subfamily)